MDEPAEEGDKNKEPRKEEQPVAKRVRAETPSWCEHCGKEECGGTYRATEMASCTAGTVGRNEASPAAKQSSCCLESPRHAERASWADIAHTWKRDGAVARQLWNNHKVAIYEPILGYDRDVVETRLPNVQHIVGTYDVVLWEVEEEGEGVGPDGESSWKRHRTPSEPTTLQLFAPVMLDDDDPHFTDFTMQGRISGGQEGGEQSTRMVFELSGAGLEDTSLDGDVTELAAEPWEDFGWRSADDSQSIELGLVVAEKKFLRWIPSENVQADSPYACQLRGELERYHAMMETNNKGREHRLSSWLVRHLSLPPPIAQHVWEYATAPRPPPTLELRKGDLWLKVLFQHYADEGTYTWIARRCPEEKQADP